jgi:hypothetical protein
MRKVDHERIAEAVASANPHNFPTSILIRLKEGSTWPDRIHTRRAHHKNREDDIMNYILAARKYFLQDDLSESAFCLGVAFHYIADGTCPGSEDPEHNSWEREISRLPLPKRLFPFSPKTPNDLFSTIKYELNIKRRTENSSFYATLRLCSSIPELVWKSVEDKNSSDEELIVHAKSELPDKSSYNLSILMIFVALGLNILLAFIFNIFQILLAIPITYGLSSIPFQRLNKRKQAVIWVLDWYGLRY